MGNLWCFRKKERLKIVLLLLGLDNAGKTVAVKNLAGEPLDPVVPTVGFSVVNLKYANYDIKVYDLGGRSDFRDIWERYYVDAHGIIYVVDSSDYDRLNEAREVLMNIISHEKIRGKPILVLANKQDSEYALDEIDIIEKLQLETLVNDYECPTLIESCAATDAKTVKVDAGIKRGYNWIINYIIKEYDILNERVDSDVDYQEELDRIERAEKMERLRYLNALEEKRMVEEESNHKQTNGLPVTDVFVIKNNRLKHSDSDTSNSTDSLPQVYYGTIQQEVMPAERPKSATNIVRQQLEQADLQLPKPAFKFSSNKTTPHHVIGVKQPQSAGERKANGTVQLDRRNLRSAGDSIFVVSNVQKLTMPVQDGSGDLQIFDITRSRNTLPPIGDTNTKMFPNGVMEGKFENYF